MSSGNFAVVFKMRDENDGSLHAVKCFLRDQPGRDESYQLITNELEFVSSNYLCGIKYLKDELFVDTASSDQDEFPVVLMDWVEGEPLDAYIRNNIADAYELHVLAYQFCRMAAWLLTQPFAHGDLKPDNILVNEDGQLVLVDYDGMYVPAMKGQKARELGSPDYRHPLRTESTFDEHIDDFSLAVIALSLKAIALNPDLLEKYGSADHLLFTESDYRDLSKCAIIDALHPLMANNELNRLYALFLIAYSQQELSAVSFRLFSLDKPKKDDYEQEVLSTKVTKEDLENSWTDEYGAKYSEDGKRLLKGTNECTSYEIRKGTKVICGRAFSWCSSLQSVTIPDSATSIGESAFYKCNALQSVTIPDSVTSIGESAFDSCSSLQSVTIPDSVTSIGDSAFDSCSSLRSVTIPDSVTSIGNNAFDCCLSLQSVTIPDSVTSIGEGAFDECRALQSVTIPDSVTSIGKWTFDSCSSLQSVTIPDSVTSIGEGAFTWCSSLQSVTIPDSVTSIGESAFDGCESLQSVTIPDSVTSIGEGAFDGCESLQKIIIPKGTRTKFEKLLPNELHKYIIEQ
jgi:serine/threonine protein kinase